MTWDFLRMQRKGNSVPVTQNFSKSNLANATDDDAHRASNIKMIAPFDQRSLNAAQDNVRNRLQEFERNLQVLSLLPEQFQQLMAPVENAVNSLTLIRNRLNLAEDSLASEQLKSGSISAELVKLQSLLERTQLSLNSEQAANSSLLQRASTLEANVNELRTENTELSAKLNRLEPQLREVIVAKDTAELELNNVLKSRAQIDDQLVATRQELSACKAELDVSQQKTKELTLISQRQQERLEEASSRNGQLEGAIASVTDQLNNAVVALQRERNASGALRAENEQLRRERQEAEANFESQIEAARSRYQVVERMLEDSRARFSEETRQASTNRRELAQRDRDLAQARTLVEPLKREIAEMRAQLQASAESLNSTTALLSAEVERRRKMELDLEAQSAENSSLVLKLKTVSEAARSNVENFAEVTNGLQQKLVAVRSENELLRSELRAYQSRQSLNAMESNSSGTPEETDTSRVVPIR